MTAYADRVYRLAYGVTRNEADAQEVVQDVFLTVYCRPSTPTATARASARSSSPTGRRLPRPRFSPASRAR